MTENNEHADGFGAALFDRDIELQTYRRGSGSNGVAFYVPEIRTGRGGQTSGARRQVRQGAMRAQERAPDYRVVAAWSGFVLFIGAGAFALGMAIQNEAHAKPPAPHPAQIYYCATGAELPAFEPCRERKDQRDI
jgi:hypothetical protein